MLLFIQRGDPVMLDGILAIGRNENLVGLAALCGTLLAHNEYFLLSYTLLKIVL